LFFFSTLWLWNVSASCSKDITVDINASSSETTRLQHNWYLFNITQHWGTS
jgi:hypothetical protein